MSNYYENYMRNSYKITWEIPMKTTWEISMKITWEIPMKITWEICRWVNWENRWKKWKRKNIFFLLMLLCCLYVFTLKLDERRGKCFRDSQERSAANESKQWVFFFQHSTLSLFIFFNWRIIALQATWVQSLSWEGPLEERNWHPTPVFLPGKLMGRRAKQSKMHYS